MAQQMLPASPTRQRTRRDALSAIRWRGRTPPSSSSAAILLSLSFVSGPDFEAKASADRDNVYEVTIRASVGGETGERTVRVTVGNVDEGPDVSGPSTRNFVENGKGAVATFTATDPEGATPIAWLVAPTITTPPTGFDELRISRTLPHFTIDKDGMLKFSSPPDFENPAGTNATENTYKVVVVACDVALDAGGGCPAHRQSWLPRGYRQGHQRERARQGHRDHLHGGWDAAVPGRRNPDGHCIRWRHNSCNSGLYGRRNRRSKRRHVAVVQRGGRNHRRPDQHPTCSKTADANNRIRVVVTYQVDGNTSRESASLTTDYPVLADRTGANALKFDPATVSRTISEGAKGRNVGAPVTATGNHGTIRYSPG